MVFPTHLSSQLCSLFIQLMIQFHGNYFYILCYYLKIKIRNIENEFRKLKTNKFIFNEKLSASLSKLQLMLKYMNIINSFGPNIY